MAHSHRIHGKTKEQYWQEGRTDARSGLKPRDMATGTWQARAYNRGYTNVTLQDPSDAPTVPSVGIRGINKSITPTLAVMFNATLGWPIAARSHALALTTDLMLERKLARRLRLLRALTRMAKRHGKPQQASPN